MSVLDSNETLKRIKEKGMKAVIEELARKSRTCGSLPIEAFCRALEDLGIKVTRNMVLRNTSNFQFQESESKENHINFISMFMFMCQIDTEEQQDEEGKEKAVQSNKFDCLFAAIKEVMRNKNQSAADIFKKCKTKDIMNLTDYENFIKSSLEVEVYFDDIEDTWKHLGEPNYLTLDDFEGLMKNKRIIGEHRPPRLQNQFSFARERTEDKEDIRQSTGRQDSAQSPYFAPNSRNRKQSDESKGDSLRGSKRNELKLKMHEVEGDKTPKETRNEKY